MSARVRLAGRLIEERVAQGLSQRQLARNSGIEVSSISRIEDAQRIPSAMTLVKLASVFGFNEGYITRLLELRDLAVQEEQRSQGSDWARGSDPGDELGGAITEPEPLLEGVSTAADLLPALKRVHIRAQEPSYREVAKSIGYSKTAVGNMLTKPKLPGSGLYRAFLSHCGIKNLKPWLDKWSEIKEMETFGEQQGDPA